MKNGVMGILVVLALLATLRLYRAEPVVVLPADEHQYPMTTEEGVEGWFVPAAAHADMMEAVTQVESRERRAGGCMSIRR